MKKLVCMALVALSAVGLLFANGETEKGYPSRDIEFIVPAEAGGGTDTINRKLISIIQKQHPEVSLYVTNNGSTEAHGPYQIMTSKPDGYRIGAMTYGSVVGSVYFKLIPQYDLSKLNIFAMVTQESDAMIVRSDSKYKTFQDLLDDAKARPNQVKIGGANAGSRTSLVISQIENTYGVDVNEVQYNGSATQREALLNGEVDAIITSLGDLASAIASKQARGLVEFGTVQNKAYPDVPPIATLGHPEIQCASFILLCAPAGTPDDVIAKLTSLYKEAQQSKDFQDWIVSIGVTPVWKEGKELSDYISNVQANAFSLLDDMVSKGLLKR